MQIHGGLFVLVVCVVLFAGQANCARKIVKAPPEVAGPLVETMAACIQETNNSSEKIKTAIKDVEDVDVEDESFMKFLDCTFQKSGYGNPDGTLNVERSAKVFPKDVDMKTVFENCNKNKGTSRVETTLKVFKCYQQTSPVKLAF